MRTDPRYQRSDSSRSADGHRGTLLRLYRKLGIRKGDVIYIHAQLYKFGKIARSPKQLVEVFLKPLQQVLGRTGTIVALTYTTSYGSHGKPFDHERSPSEAGLLTEYIRTSKGAVRSFHPIGSVAAIGKHKHHICDRVSRSQFGWGSVYHRLHQLGAKCLYLGITLGETCTFMHYVEQLYGVSHCYHKAFFYPAYRRGMLRKGPFLSFVRNRASEPYDFRPFEKFMKRRQLVKEGSYRRAPIQLVKLTDCFTMGMQLLDRDPCFFIASPFYVTT